MKYLYNQNIPQKGIFFILVTGFVFLIIEIKKRVVAFANTQGGTLVIGVDDKTREVVGIDGEYLFRMMDSISNAVSDSCVPQIVPNVEPQTIDGKTVIVVTVAPGPNKPYYLKSRGKDAGTFIRVAGTSRPEYPEKIKELEMEGERISWDELTCVGYGVTENAIEHLCNDIMGYRQRAGLSQREVTKSQLINWKLLREKDGGYAASNAFVLLTSDYFPFSKTQYAVFKGTERNIFLDKREFTGPIYEQIEEAAAFVLRNIRLGAKIEGLIRKESYELPVEAIREMIINAHCHRNLIENSCVQVAIYDDRLEVTSPGGLYNGLTYEDILNGHSKLRNRTIANVFNQMGLIEAWGTGIKRIISLSEIYGLPSPKIQEFDSMFRINLYRTNSPMADGCGIGETPEKNQCMDKRALNDTQQQIITLLSRDAQLTASKMAEQIGISKRNIESNIQKLKEKGILSRHGSSKNGYWEIMSQAGF